MTKENENTMDLMEALGEVDEKMVQQAIDLDGPEAFEELRKPRVKKPWSLIAACITLVLILTSIPVYSSLIGPFLSPSNKFTETYNHKEPPELLAYNGLISIKPYMTGYDWSCNLDWDNPVDISAPFINPLSLELEGKIPKIQTSESTLQFELEEDYDSIHVRAWPAEQFGNMEAYDIYETVTVISREITLRTGHYIYEVFAEWRDSYWGSGQVTYVFAVDCTYVIPTPETDIRIISGDMTLTDPAGGLKTGNRYDDVAGKWIPLFGSGAYWTMHHSVLQGAETPGVTLDQDIQLHLGENGTLGIILVYYRHSEHSPGIYMRTDNPADLSTLPPGKWHVLLNVTWLGRYIESEEQYETYSHEYVFILEVPEPEIPPFTWKFDEITETLTVGGCEELQDFLYGASETPWTIPPWDEHREQVKHVVVADGVTRIGDYAFSNMPNLQTVTLPEGLEEIGNSAFQHAANITQIQFPSSLKKIGDCCFEGCEKLDGFTLPEGLTHVGQYAFQQCAISGVMTIPESVVSLGWGSFNYCRGLTEVIVLGSPNIMNNVFTGCARVRIMRFTGNAPVELGSLISANDVVICFYPVQNATWNDEVLDTANPTNTVWFGSEDPLTAKWLENDTSGYCGRMAYWELKDGVLTITGSGSVSYIAWENYRDQIKKVVIQDGITSIPNAGFINCEQLTSVSIPNTVEYIGFSAFTNCKKLKAVTLPESLTGMGSYAFMDCTALTKITIPDSLTIIPYMAFAGCTNLNEILFPDGLTEIEYGAFTNCKGLVEVHFPATLKSLGDYAFAGCKRLTKIYFYSDVPSVKNFTFSGVAATAYYPPGNLSWISGGMAYHSGDIREKADPNQPPQ